MSLMVIGGLLILFNLSLVWWLPLRRVPELGWLVILSALLAGALFGQGFVKVFFA